MRSLTDGSIVEMEECNMSNAKAAVIDSINQISDAIEEIADWREGNEI